MFFNAIQFLYIKYFHKHSMKCIKIYDKNYYFFYDFSMRLTFILGFNLTKHLCKKPTTD